MGVEKIKGLRKIFLLKVLAELRKLTHVQYFKTNEHIKTYQKEWNKKLNYPH